MASWQTIRLRNADGTSSVYKVHDSVNTHDHDVFHSSSSMSSASLPPQVILGGSTGGGRIHHYGHAGSPMPASSVNTAAPPYYGHNTLYSTHSAQPHSQPPMVILKPNKKRRKSNCANKCNTSSNPLCITFGVILSLLVIVGYVCLIVALIPGSTKNRWNEQDVLSSMAATVTTAEGGDGNDNRQQQLSKQDLMQNGASPMLLRSSDIDGDVIPRRHSYNAIVTILDPVDAPQQLTTQDQSPKLLRKVASNRASHEGEPVRRLRRRRRRGKLHEDTIIRSYT
ncbi:hypothetical protein QTG54_008203 [Skeletonema marinoi]|uniref:Uncharacterized protein n=1 Tax=Skeletonema marinoi TaxID=267567 RepID=A0AAD9DB28_9STRA|nr:hypothetical protein QTG54_008203 [Skeletonema marinoi]